MMKAEKLENLNQPELAQLAIDFLRRSLLHYGLWFNEVQYQLGLEEALKAEAAAFSKLYPIIIKRLSNIIGFKVENDLPCALSGMPRDKIVSLIEAISANWLASDGIWFQTVESRQEIFTAKRCNDTCWAKFSPLEAFRIKELLVLSDNGGLDSLEIALGYRLYSRINRQSLERHNNSLIFKMLNCRVQEARVRKGMDDYPCKSGGMVEYTGFARTIDRRIMTECIACPPDNHPDDWFCAWKFYIP